MKTLICTLNSKYIHSSLSVWCLYTACGEYCKSAPELKVFEGTINTEDDSLLENITNEKAEIIAFSVYIWNREKVLRLCGKIKETQPQTLIILGGPEVAYDQRSVLENHNYIDYVLSGEGEIILPKLLDCLSGGLSPEGIDGVSFRSGNSLIIKNEVIGESFDYPTPYCKEYLNSLGGRLAYLEASRGCPFNCAYCLSGRCGKVKFKSLEQTKKEILLLANSGTKTVKLVDRTFNCNNGRATEILRFINKSYGKEIPDGVCFHFEISGDILKDSFLDEVSSAPAGAFQFELGIQSLNKATLDAIGRKSEKEKLFCNIKKLVALRNCHIHTDLISGLPNETLKSFTDGFNESYTLGADMLQLGFLKLLHGSPLRDKSSAFGFEFSHKPPYEIISTPTMSRADLDTLRAAEKEVDRLHNSGRFRRTLEYIFSVTSLTPFELFHLVGEAFAEASLPLDAYTNTLFGILSDIDGINPAVLRDRMITDRLATNNSGIIPKSLIIEDKKLKRVKNLLAVAHPLKKGVNRCTAIIYTESRVIYCDYEKKNAVTGEYEIRSENFDFFGETFFEFDIDK